MVWNFLPTLLLHPSQNTRVAGYSFCVVNATDSQCCGGSLEVVPGCSSQWSNSGPTSFGRVIEYNYVAKEFGVRLPWWVYFGRDLVVPVLTSCTADVLAEWREQYGEFYCIDLLSEDLVCNSSFASRVSEY